MAEEMDEIVAELEAGKITIDSGVMICRTDVEKALAATDNPEALREALHARGYSPKLHGYVKRS